MWNPQGIFCEYILRTPALLFGNESVSGLYNYPASRIAVIHGSSFSDKELLRKIFKKKTVSFFMRSWNGEPDIDGIQATLHDIEDFAPDTIIAIGGGSVIDGAKLCRLLYEIPFFVPGKSTLDGGILSTRFIVIPTTIGSGAEISSAAVYISNKRKEMIVMHDLIPDVIVYDNQYVASTPKKLMCASSLDAMAHVVEGFISNVRNKLIELKAVEALRLLRIELSKYLADEEVDYSVLQYVGYLGGIIQNHCIVGACHAVAHQLTGFGFSHGEGVSLLLSPVIKNNANNQEVEKRYTGLCNASGFDSIRNLESFIDSLCLKSGIANRRDELKKVLVDNESNEEFIENIKNDRGGKGNPVEITDDYIRDLIGSL